MNKLSNQVQLRGRVGKDLELKHTSNGKAYVNLTLATNEKYTDKSGVAQEETSWHNLIAWGKTAELMSRLLNKGSDAIIMGKLKYETYTDKEGIKRNSTKIIVDEFIAGSN